jgi:hypothetical protein
MHKTFLFRFDGAGENDEFLDHARSQGHVVYSGIEMKLTRGWIPDFLEVSLNDNPVACSLTIFELESTEHVARASARKYLPESSHDILEIFRRYLHRVLQRCRSTADPRAGDIQQLDEALGRAEHTSIWTAAALRRPPQTVERLPLIDQGIAPPKSAIDSRTHNQTSSLSGRTIALFTGTQDALSIDPYFGCGYARVGQKRCISSGMAKPSLAAFEERCST